MMERQCDFLVIGSGIAGLVFALKAADKGSVTIITKSNEDESNTKYAQGGIAAVMHQPEGIEKHVQDTLKCGAGLCDETIVRMVVEEAEKGISELVRWGVDFDRSAGGNYDLAREGGHSENRILHHKDITGYEIERALLDRINRHPSIQLLPHHLAIDIITQHHLNSPGGATDAITCFGAYVFNEKTGQISTFLSRITLMATGGAGQAYLVTTNPSIATGDGIAMVQRAGGRLRDMEFMQFHPTSLYQPGISPSFLITEAMRGHGAVLRNIRHEDYMPNYHPQGSLAPRDIVARATDNEMKLHGSDHVWLDCTAIPADEIEERFPTINARCRDAGIDLSRQFIPVAPAAHYLCGGIEVDMNGKSSIHNLYAVGECARTGLHGANRLASNSLLEAVVFGNRAARHAVQSLGNIKIRGGVPVWDDKGTEEPEELILINQSRKELQQIMSAYVGIVRSGLRLERALSRLQIIQQETETLYKKTRVSVKLIELRNLISIAGLIIAGAQGREESIGLHYMTDHPTVKH